MFDPFATAADLEVFLKRDLTDAEQDVAGILLAGLSAAIREDCGQVITEGTSTVTLPGSGERKLVLPQQPVRSVAAVTWNGTVAPSGGDTGWQLRNGQLVRPCGWSEWEWFEVTFTHGYSAVPADVFAFVLLAAGEGMKGAVGLRSEQVGPFARSFLDNPPGEHIALSLGDIVRRYSTDSGVHMVRSGS